RFRTVSASRRSSRTASVEYADVMIGATGRSTCGNCAETTSGTPMSDDAPSEVATTTARWKRRNPSAHARGTSTGHPVGGFTAERRLDLPATVAYAVPHRRRRL